MQVLYKDLKRGIIKLLPQTLDDIYSLSLLIRPGDVVVAKTTRRIRRSTQDVDRPDEGRRETFSLGVKVEQVEITGFSDSLRVHGIIVEGPEDKIDLYSHHSLSIKMNEPLTIKKEQWSREDLLQIEEAVESSQQAPLIVVGMESDEAVVALVSAHSTRVIGEFRPTVSRKASSPKEHEQETKQFWLELAEYLNQLQKKHKPDAIIVAGPGFWKNNFVQFAVGKFPDLKGILLAVAASTGGRVGISEVLSRGVPAKFAEKRRAIIESELINEVMKRLGKGEHTVTYGYDSVSKAVTYGAVEHLLVLDKMLADLNLRPKLEALLREARALGSKTTIISSFHETGKLVEGLGGIIALLRYPLAEL